MYRIAIVLLLWGTLPGWLSVVNAGEPMQVGTGVTEITPPEGYPMSGYFYERGATGTLDPLYAKAVVFKQGDSSAALIVCDMIGVDLQLTEAIRGKVVELTGIPAENIVVAATHSHTGPNYKADLLAYLENNNAPGRARYIPYLVDRCSTAAADATHALRPVTLRVGEGREEGVSFNRRFVLKDGTVRTWAKLADDDVVKAAGPIDPAIGLVTFTPTAGEATGPTAALVNFSLHCDTVGGTLYSGDFPGHIERVLRRDLGSNFVSVFATGPCGDINHADPTGAPRRSSAEIGERLALAAEQALPDLQPVTPSLAVRRTVLQMPLQTYTAEDLAWAKDLKTRKAAGEKFKTTIDAKASKFIRLERLRTGVPDAGRDTGESGLPVHDGSDSLPAEVQVIRLGADTALVALPGEIFVELGLAIKAGSPFAHTFVIELANDNPAYVPTRQAMQQGGYEANNSLYAAGSGERLVATALELLNELH